MTLLVAVVLGVLIGLTMGALGGGGSILTVPVLVYVVGLSATSATTASLVIVGVASAVAALGHARSGRVRWRTGLAFGATGVASSYAGTLLNARVAPDALMISFGAVMLVAATAMLVRTAVPARPSEAADDDRAARLRTSTRVRGGDEPEPAAARRAPAPRAGSRVGTALKVLVAGLVVGFLTGFLGVGGGFVIVPVLVLALRHEMPSAVGTSLLVISLNSAVSLVARGSDEVFEWSVIVPFTLAAVAGSATGKRIGDRVSGARLTRAFAVLLLAVAAYVLTRTALGS